MRGPSIGMGPVHYQKPGKKLKRCSEFHTDPCDVAATDQCCAIISCLYCLEWQPYGQSSQFGSAKYKDGRWTGTVDGLAFVAYWEHGYESGKCEFVVIFDGVEVSRQQCAGGDDELCRDSTGSAAAWGGYEFGTILWTRHLFRPLPYRRNDSNCVTWYCGEEECTCKQLCVSVSIKIPYGSYGFIGSGTIDESVYSDDCDPPAWSGSVETVFSAATKSVPVDIRLERDEYSGDCIIGGEVTIDETTHTLPWAAVIDAKTISVNWTLSDGSLVQVRCKKCSCAQTQTCEFCCLPMDFTNPIYPNGVYRPIPFELIGCGGGSGSFETQPGNQPCQDTMMFDTSVDFVPVTVLGTRYFVDLPSGYTCPSTPCSVTLYYKLECNADIADGSTDPCDSIRLWIGSLNKLVGETGTIPGGRNYSVPSWIWVRPTSCECDPVGGVMLRFAFTVQTDCSASPIGVNGACAGVRLDCCTFSCSGEIVI